MDDETAWLPSELAPVALRLARADEAAFTIGELALEWSRQPLDCAQVDNGDAGIDLVVNGIRPVPPLLSMLFSEAIHHLRGAIENTLFHLVSASRGEELPETQARAIEMPIYEDPSDLEKWQKARTKRGVAELGTESNLGQRIAKLQPYADPAAVHSHSTLYGALTGVEPETAHPMLLLQKYSNEDKHRAIRMAAARTLVQNWAEPFFTSDRSMRPLEVGDVLATTQRGVVVPVDLTSAVLVQRPESAAWVSPVRELDHLRRHVADIVIPTLVTGSARTRSVPPKIDLTDTGQEASARIRSGSWEPASQRLDRISAAALDEAIARPPRIPPMRGRSETAEEPLGEVE